MKIYKIFAIGIIRLVEKSFNNEIFQISDMLFILFKQLSLTNSIKPYKISNEKKDNNEQHGEVYQHSQIYVILKRVKVLK